MSIQIRELFVSGKDIYRTIEKVITYSASQESRLRSEISEYVVTESIEEQFEKLLSRMQLAMETGGENEIGVWVSGFYGSGKSSFTKYLGLAFDDRRTIDGVPFIRRLQDRLHTPQVKALLNKVAKDYPAAVVMLDLAGEMLAGAAMADVSTVLYFKVLQWAGYSRNLKVAALERRLEKDGRFSEFEAKLEARLPGMPWKDLQNDPLSVDSLIPQIAHEMYPQLFLTPNAFNTNTEDFLQLENQRVEEMLSIIREKSGKRHIIFVVDELGQYIANSDSHMLNTQGLAQNLKRVGGGKVWFIATAQQTLTEDDERWALNSGKLFKLKDRFPIQIELESSDIKEICYRRLLSKSPVGEEELGKLFDAHGQALRFNTKLKDAKYYDSDFDRKAFIDLYPFLPAHFEILLYLLGSLAKTTGGVGLRSAIKVIQDILVEGGDGRSPAAEQSLGWLATTVTLYDALEKEIRRSFSSIHQGVESCLRIYKSPLHAEVAKSIAVLQLLGNLPVNAENLASLTHPSVNHPSRLDDVRKVVEEMLNEPLAPLGEKDGSLYFLSPVLRDIEQERGAIPTRDIETQRIFNNALRAAIDPLPRFSLGGTYTVTAGLKIQVNDRAASLAGEQNAIQLVVEFATGEYEANRNRLVEDSRQRTNQNVIFLIGRENPEFVDLAREIYRCQQIVELHRNDPNQEVRDYCNNQLTRADKLNSQLQQKIDQTLSQGSFIFRGQYTAVTTLDQDLLKSAQKFLGQVAEQVFDRYAEAPVRVETNLAEKFLRTGNPMAITTALDPLALVEVVGGNPNFKHNHKAITSIRDYIELNGNVEGKRLLDHFSDPPYGWSQDTLRYIVAAMLIAGEIKLKVSGRVVTTAGQQAIDALKTNKSFGSVGVAMRDGRPSNEMLARAAERLTDLIGDMIIPLEQEISKAAVRNFQKFQGDYAPLAEKLDALRVGGAERVRSMTRDITDLLSTDASDAPQRLGGEESALYDSLKWAGAVKAALGNGLEATIRDLQSHRREIESLPDFGAPGALRRESADDLTLIAQRLEKDDFHHHAVDFNSSLTRLKTLVRDAVIAVKEQQKLRLQESVEDLQRMPEWAELTQEERGNSVQNLEKLLTDASPDLAGLRQLLARDYDINTSLSHLKESIRRQGQERLLQRLEDERAKVIEKGPARLKKSVVTPATITNAAQLDELIRQLQKLKEQSALYAEIEITFSVQP